MNLNNPVIALLNFLSFNGFTLSYDYLCVILNVRNDVNNIGFSHIYFLYFVLFF